MLSRGQPVYIVYGDGVTVSATRVFYDLFSGGDHVTFQTCIAREGHPYWGRLFVVAQSAP